MTMRRLDTVFTEIRVIVDSFDMPLIATNQTEFIEKTISGIGLDWCVLFFAPMTDFSTGEDLLWTAFVTDTDTLRLTALNPNSPVNPDSIDFGFVLGKLNPDVIEP